MADLKVKISEFPLATEAKDSDDIAILQDGVNKRIKTPKIEEKILEKVEERYVNKNKLGVSNGVATLGSDGRLSESQRFAVDINPKIIPIDLTTPPSEVDGVFLPTTSGVYENYGGLSIDLDLGSYLITKIGDVYKSILLAVESTLIANNIEDLRSKEPAYEGQIITLLGYYEAGDKEPLNYKWTSEQGIDDGGSIINTESGSWMAVFTDLINAEDFGCFPNINDNSEQLNKALNVGLDVKINTPLRISNTVYVNSFQFLIGAGYSHVRDVKPTGYLIKDADIRGVELNGRNNGLKDFHIFNESLEDTKEGIVVRSARATLLNVSTSNNGGDGIRLGDEKKPEETSRPNCNLFSFNNIYSVNNGGWGVVISDGETNPQQDCNAGTFNLADIRNNIGGGLLVNKANDNTFIGVNCQNNIGVGITCEGRGNTFINCYTEANDINTPIESRTDFHFTTNSVRNRFMFYYSGQVNDRIKNEGSSNFIIGTNSRVGQYINRVNTPRLAIFGESSGFWNVANLATRDLLIELTETSSNGSVDIKTQNPNGASLFVDGRIIASHSIRLGSKTSSISIRTGTDINPNGLVAGIAGSLYIVRGNPSNLKTRFWIKQSGSGTDTTEWIPLSYTNASLTDEGVVKQSTNITDITIPDATDLESALTLVNELKTKLNAKLTADRNSGQQSTT